MQSFFSELKRRNVVKVGIAYAVMAWVLVQAADILLPTFGAPEGFLKGFYIVLALGFPIATFLAWAFEITPEGVKKTKEVDKSQSITPHTGQKINRLIAVGLILALGFIAYDKFIAGDRVVSEAEAGSASIAVLPFVNMSSDPEQDYFSDGISEELLNLLAKIPDLKVAGRTSSFAFKGENQDLRDIGDTLGVSFLLEGSVRKQDNKVRITAQLIKASDGTHVWSETYDRTLDDIFAIQDEISAAITRELKIRILGEGTTAVQAQKVDPEAHSYYLLGLQRLNAGEFDTLQQAKEYFRKAYEISPGYMDALWGYGLAIADLQDYGVIDREEAVRELNMLLNRIRKDNPDDAPMTSLIAAKLEALRNNREASAALLQKAYAGDPKNPRILFAMVRSNIFGGNFQKAQEFAKTALESDPLNIRTLRFLSFAQTRLNEVDEAEKTIRRTIEIDPEYAGSYVTLANLLFNRGEYGASLENLIIAEQKDPFDPDGPAFVANMLLPFGFLDEAEALLDKAEAMSPNEVLTIALRAKLLFSRGKLEEALEVAEGLLLAGRESRHFSGSIAGSVAQTALLQTGQPAKLLDLVFARVPELKTDSLDYTTDIDGGTAAFIRINYADDLARAYFALGEDDKASTILKAARAAYRKLPDNEDRWGEVEIDILLGDLDTAMEIVKAPVNRTTLVYYLLTDNLRWRLDTLVGNPEFDAIAAETDAIIARERPKMAKILADHGLSK